VQKNNNDPLCQTGDIIVVVSVVPNIGTSLSLGSIFFDYLMPAAKSELRFKR